MTLDDATLDELARLDAARTPGVWFLPGGHRGGIYAPPVRPVPYDDGDEHDWWVRVTSAEPADGTAIVSAVNALAPLITELRKERGTNIEWQIYAAERNHPFKTPWPTWSDESLAVKAELEAKVADLEAKLTAAQVRIANFTRYVPPQPQFGEPRRGYGYRMCCRENTCEDGAHDGDDD